MGLAPSSSNIGKVYTVPNTHQCKKQMSLKTWIREFGVVWKNLTGLHSPRRKPDTE